MGNFSFSSQVCEQLARELVTEQTEVLKHQAVVDGIRKVILEKKTEIIKQVVDGKMFRYEGKQVIVLGVESFKTQNGIFVMMSFCENPVNIINDRLLTRREAELLDNYKRAFSHCVWEPDKSWEHELFDAANRLARLKNHIDLTENTFWEFSFTETSNPNFFKESGIGIGVSSGINCKRIFLEDAIIKRFR